MIEKAQNKRKKKKRRTVGGMYLGEGVSEEVSLDKRGEFEMFIRILSHCLIWSVLHPADKCQLVPAAAALVLGTRAGRHLPVCRAGQSRARARALT